MPRNKLTLEDVEEIKRLYKSGDVSMNQLALIYTVDVSTIHRAIREYTHRVQKTFGEIKK